MSSVYSLQAELSRVQGELSRIQRENQRISSEIAMIAGAVGAATGALVETSNHVGSTLQTGASRLTNAHQMAIATYELQGEISVLYERLKRMELANKRIRELQNTRIYDFKTYRQIRKIVQGVMDNLDFNMVSYDVIEKAIEKNHLQTPDYWLTCVLLAVVAWIDGSKERAERALNQALQLDKKRTASFLLIFNLRMGRDEAAVKWFEMLRGLPMVGADKSMILLYFSLLSRTIRESVAEPTRQRIIAHIRQLMSETLESAGVSQDDVVHRVEKLMVDMCSSSAFDYPLLVKHCPSWTSLWTPLVMARNNQKLTNYYAAIADVGESVTNEFLKVYIDEVVAAPSATEQDVYDEIERNENIIRFQGDAESADADYTSRKTADAEQLDIVERMLHWIYDPAGALEANQQMRLNMLTLLKELQLTAAGQYVEHYRSAFITKAEVAVDDFKVMADLENMSQAKGAAQAHCDMKRDAEQAAIKDLFAYVAFGGAAAIVVAAILMKAPALLVLSLAGIVGGVGFLFYNKREREKLALKWDGIARNMQSTLDEVALEFGNYSREYAEWDMLADRLVAQLEAL